MSNNIGNDFSLESTKLAVIGLGYVGLPLAVEFGKTPRSIIAKLSALGIYVKTERATKRGEPVVRKDELVAQVQASIGRELPSLVKMTKVDLQNLINFFSA